MIFPPPALAIFLLDLRGPEFLALYLFLMAIALVGLGIYRSGLNPVVSEPLPPLPNDLDARELAWIRGGTEELVRISGLDLLQRGYLIQRGNTLAVHPSPPPKRHLPKALQSMLDIMKSNPSAGDLLRRTAVVVGGEAAGYEERAREAGLLTGRETQARMDKAAWRVALVLLGIGILKIWRAVSQGHHNIVFLIVLMCLACIGILIIRKLPRLSARGRNYMDQARNALYQLKERVGSLAQTNDPLLVLAAAAFGLAVLTPTAYGDYYRYYVPQGSSSGGSCGSGSGCGSGCGGGCGSGCGGCGGGGD